MNFETKNEKRTTEGALEVRLSLDSSSFDLFMSKLISSFKGFSNGDLEVLNGFFGGSDTISKFISLDADSGPTPSAGNYRVVLKPSDGFRELLATLWASKT